MQLTDFPITRRWPPQDPARLQYYGLATPNGIKVSVMLEETGLPYEAHRIDIGDAALDQKTPEFVSLNPNGRIPAILDPDGPEGRPFGLAESGAILLYLAEKTGRFLPAGAEERWRTVQWLMFQMGGVGPMFGQLGFFHRYGGRDYEDKRPRDRYLAETRRLLGVLEAGLAGRDWLAGDYSVADMATAPWLRGLLENYGAGPLVGWDEGYPALHGWLARFLARPAVQRGLTVCA